MNTGGSGQCRRHDCFGEADRCRGCGSVRNSLPQSQSQHRQLHTPLVSSVRAPLRDLDVPGVRIGVRMAKHRLGRCTLAMGFLGSWLVVAMLFAVVIPDGSYLFEWPLIAALAAWIWIFVRILGLLRQRCWYLSHLPRWRLCSARARSCCPTSASMLARCQTSHRSSSCSQHCGRAPGA
jgi:hypothetical protein